MSRKRNPELWDRHQEVWSWASPYPGRLASAMRTAMALLGGASHHNGSSDVLTKELISATVKELGLGMTAQMAKWLNDQIVDLPTPEDKT